jgi:CBS domain-containing protein
MAKKKSDSPNRSSSEQKIKLRTRKFYKIPLEEFVDHRVWDLPLIEKDDVVLNLLAILSGRDHVWVVENMESRELLGVVTEHDILNILTPSKKVSFFGSRAKRSQHLEILESVEHIMQDHPISCTADQTIGDVLRKMTSHGCRRMAIIDPDNDQIIGEITLHQIIRKFYEGIRPLGKICAEELERKSKK